MTSYVIWLMYDKTVAVKKRLTVDKCLVKTIGYASAFGVPRGCWQIVSAIHADSICLASFPSHMLGKKWPGIDCLHMNAHFCARRAYFCRSVTFKWGVHIKYLFYYPVDISTTVFIPLQYHTILHGMGCIFTRLRLVKIRPHTRAIPSRITFSPIKYMDKLFASTCSKHK